MGKLAPYQDLEGLRYFLSEDQRQCLRENLSGEESEFFASMLEDLHKRVQTMPRTYDLQKAGVNGMDAVVHLHYFKGRCDWYILEKDKGSPDDVENGIKPGAQHQAFGWTDLGDPEMAEFGYISIEELRNLGVELDLYWNPRPLREIIIINTSESIDMTESINDLIARLSGCSEDAKKKINQMIGQRFKVYTLPAFIKAPTIPEADKIAMLKEIVTIVESGDLSKLDGVTLAKGEAGETPPSPQAPAPVSSPPPPQPPAVAKPVKQPKQAPALPSSPPTPSPAPVGDEFLALIRVCLERLGYSLPQHSPAAAPAVVDESVIKPIVEQLLNAYTGEMTDVIKQHLAGHKTGKIVIQIGELPKVEASAVHVLQEALIARMVASHRPVVLVGPEASGRTEACRLAAKAIDNINFYVQCVTADTTVSDLVADCSPFRCAFSRGGVWLCKGAEFLRPDVRWALETAIETDSLNVLGFGFPQGDPLEKIQNERFYPVFTQSLLKTDSLLSGIRLNWHYDEALELKLFGGGDDEAGKRVKQAHCIRKALIELDLPEPTMRDIRDLVALNLRTKLPVLQSMQATILRRAPADQHEAIIDRAKAIAKGHGETSTNEGHHHIPAL